MDFYLFLKNITSRCINGVGAIELARRGLMAAYKRLSTFVRGYYVRTRRAFYF